MTGRQLRITHVLPQIGIGGTELQLCRLISASPAARAVHRVLFYDDSLDDEGTRIYRDNGIQFDRVQRGRVSLPLFLRRLAKAIGRSQPDIVHCWLVSAALWGRWAAALSGAPCIVLSIRSTRVDLAWLLRASRLADGPKIHYLANSEAVAESIHRFIGAPWGRIAVIPNGIDLADHPPSFSRDDLLRECSCPTGTIIALTVGRLSEAKNYPMLLRVAARCRGRIPVHFFIAGHGEDQTTLMELARQLGVEDVVHFLGLRTDVPALLRRADFFFYTSRFEGSPNALLEAMAAALPIVTTRFVGVESLITPGRNGLVVEQDDDEGAYKALGLLVKDGLTAQVLGSAARRTVEERFSMERMVQATLRYYEDLASVAPSGPGQ
jgi:glycosyltransferase involved in cell wall biosynthesis